MLVIHRAGDVLARFLLPSSAPGGDHSVSDEAVVILNHLDDLAVPVGGLGGLDDVEPDLGAVQPGGVEDLAEVDPELFGLGVETKIFIFDASFTQSDLAEHWLRLQNSLLRLLNRLHSELSHSAYSGVREGKMILHLDTELAFTATKK